MTDDEVQAALATEETGANCIVKHRGKVASVPHNARCVLQLQQSGGACAFGDLAPNPDPDPNPIPNTLNPTSVPVPLLDCYPNPNPYLHPNPNPGRHLHPSKARTIFSSLFWPPPLLHQQSPLNSYHVLTNKAIYLTHANPKP